MVRNVATGVRPPRGIGRGCAGRLRAGRTPGFTLIELLIVVAMIGILATLALPMLQRGPVKAKEAVLRTNLHTLRDVLDQYYADRQKCADSLQTLVDDGYLRIIPEDPMTGSSDTWVVEYCEGEDAELGALQDEFLSQGPGIWDVKSGATGRALDGTNYADW